ncbi:MAG: chemotaxis protein CheX [Thermaerobacter sp.]|nr:chemotaxis protein CheX [Thermaerobacter sp.]
MKVEWINPFIRAANHVLGEMVSFEHPQLGRIEMEEKPYTTEEVTAMLGVSGVLSGSVLLGMTRDVAEQIVERMVGERTPIEDLLGESALGEVVNMISGSALRFLESAGYSCNITPPVVIRGQGAVVSTMERQRLVVPIHFPTAVFQLSVALRQA